jgi:hypothetical protein
VVRTGTAALGGRALPRTLAALLVAALALGLLPGLARATPAVLPANDAFQRAWARTDQPVADGTVARTWMWGPQALLGRTETYNGRQRTVQYYDKSRMEMTNPAATDDGLWYVTNGLLVRELVTGDMQVGTAEFEQHPPSSTNVAGDLDDTSAPTYAALAELLEAPAVANDATLTQRIDHDGAVSNDPALARRRIRAAQRVTVAGIDHQVAAPFWAFMTASGVVVDWATNQRTTAPLFQNPYYATGYPITEAYWARVMVAGTTQDVLLQCFERRCLTYTPGNPRGWQVEAGNVGQHYYLWRYGVAPVTPPTAAHTVLTVAGLGAAAERRGDTSANGVGQILTLAKVLRETDRRRGALAGVRVRDEHLALDFFEEGVQLEGLGQQAISGQVAGQLA